MRDIIYELFLLGPCFGEMIKPSVTRFRNANVFSQCVLLSNEFSFVQFSNKMRLVIMLLLLNSVQLNKFAVLPRQNNKYFFFYSPNLPSDYDIK